MAAASPDSGGEEEPGQEAGGDGSGPAAVSTQRLRLSDGRDMPMFGLGVWCATPGAPTEQAVLAALTAGYRMVDTAALYRNEASVGAALRKSGLRRDEVFVVTKLWNDCHGRRKALRACRESLQRLGLDYVDLYLIHSPIGGRQLETWDAMLELRDSGLALSVGVSNFGVQHLEGIRQAGREAPAVNQVELHPFLQQRDVVSYCRQHDIAVMGYSPLARSEKLRDRTVAGVAQRAGCTPAQAMIRWALQHDIITIPKSVNENRVVENAQVFDWVLSPEDMARLDALDCDFRTCWNPLTQPWDP